MRATMTAAVLVFHGILLELLGLQIWLTTTLIFWARKFSIRSLLYQLLLLLLFQLLCNL
jgi:hypothetical protein